MEISPPRIDLIAILQQNNGEQSLADRLEALVQRTSVDGQLPLICQSLTRLAERAEFDIALSWELWQLAIRHEVWRGQYTSLEEFKEEYNYNVALKHVLQSHGLSKSQRDIYSSLHVRWNRLPNDLLPTSLKPPSWSNNLLSYLSQLSRKNVPYERAMKLLRDAVIARTNDVSLSDHSIIVKARRARNNGKTKAPHLIISDVRAVLRSLKAEEEERMNEAESASKAGAASEGEDASGGEAGSDGEDASNGEDTFEGEDASDGEGYSKTGSAPKAEGITEGEGASEDGAAFVDEGFLETESASKADSISEGKGASEGEDGSEGERASEVQGVPEAVGARDAQSTHNASKRNRQARSEVDYRPIASMRDQTPEMGRTTLRRLSQKPTSSSMEWDDSLGFGTPTRKKLKMAGYLSPFSASDKPDETSTPKPSISLPLQDTPIAVPAQHESGCQFLTPQPHSTEEADKLTVERNISFVLKSPPSFTCPPALSINLDIPPPEGSRLPTTDVEGALNSLRPRKWLSATAIELVLSMCSVYGIRVFHGLSLSQPSPPVRHGKSRVILLPIYHASHWILAKVDIKSRVITVYDFLSDALVTLAKQALLHFAAALDHQRSDWSFVAIHSPAQEKGYDCGVLLLITALHLLVPLPLPSSYHCDVWRRIFATMLGGSSEEATYRALEEAVEYQGNNTHSISSFGSLVRVRTRQVADSISQLEETAQALQTKLDTISTRIIAQESAAGVLRGLSKRITAFLDSLAQDRDVVERDIALLEDTMSRYSGVQAYRNDLVVAQIRKDQAEAARSLTSKKERIRGVEDNITGVKKAISLLDRTRGEDQAMLESLVQDTRAGLEAFRKEQSKLLDKIDHFLNENFLNV
ncbi:MAG: hypothetical protein LQ341_006142 [Variospora aurantia]|nr:MAG: hypothetical protein LQ341_006142 [Variospora aurantia]